MFKMRASLLIVYAYTPTPGQPPTDIPHPGELATTRPASNIPMLGGLWGTRGTCGLPHLRLFRTREHGD